MMKTVRFIFMLLFFTPFLIGCDEEMTEEEEPERTTHLVTLNNNSGLSGCTILDPVKITFVISYRDVQAFVDIEPERGAFLNVLVEDKESINVQVRKFSDGTLLADKDVSVRTTSRPSNLDGEPRTISYCRAFNLAISGF